MARLVGIDLPKTKRIVIALTYIQGIGLKTAESILLKLKIDINTRAADLSEKQIVDLRSELQQYVLHGHGERHPLWRATGGPPPAGTHAWPLQWTCPRQKWHQTWSWKWKRFRPIY